MQRKFLVVALFIQSASAGDGILSNPPRATYRVAILNDVSRSIPRGCEAVAGLTGQALSLPTMPNSTLLYLSTGDRRSTYEPILKRSFTLPGTTRVFEAKGFEKEKSYIIGSIADECAKSATTEISPIFQALKTT